MAVSSAEYGRRWRAEHRDELRAKKAAYYQANKTAIRTEVQRRYREEPEYKAKRMAEQRAAYAKNREQRKSKVRARYAEKREEILAGQRQRYAEDAEYRAKFRERYEVAYAKNRESYFERARRRRVQKHENGPVEKFTADDVFARSLGLCGICGAAVTSDFHIDHIIPISRGGTHTLGNVQLAHPKCNLSKGAK
jgi:5-methylcytosine-specific restriction endonuclease McrA